MTTLPKPDPTFGVPRLKTWAFRRVMMYGRITGDVRSWRCSRPPVDPTPLLPFRRMA